MKFILNKDPLSYEVNAIVMYLKNYKFFEKYKYNVSYPEYEEFKELLNKARNGDIEDSDYEEVQSQFKKILDIDKYNALYEKCKNVIIENNKILEKTKSLFEQLSLNFDFKLFDNYLVNITKYGPGGSYDSSDGSILIKYGKNGIKFSTLIHELFHIGIEESIIQKYNINHGTKEYIVDTFMLTYFNTYFDNYVYQALDDNIDEYVKENIKVGFDFNKLDYVMSLKI